jgi:predicted aspartyl protease
MPEYDRENFDPSAPVAHVTLRHPATGATISDVPMLIDTGADITFLSRETIEELNIVPEENKAYEVEGFTGGIALAEVVRLELLFLGKRFTGQFLVTDQSMGILGRNVLNAVCVLLDGPRGFWDEA